ncbi:MAG: SDR family NAD(P)-dependent oxidoreductase [Planctomycetota bacterium]
MPLIVRFRNGDSVELEGDRPLLPADQEELERLFGSPITSAIVAPEQVSSVLQTPSQDPTQSPDQRPQASRRLAVIGMAGRFPGVRHLDEWWQTISEQRNPITEVPPARERLYASPVTDIGVTEPVRRWGGFLDGVDQFDASFFGLSRREAERMDPQHRILLEVAWEALENGGIAGKRIWGSRTGVFVGISNNEYLHRFLRQPNAIDQYMGSGNTLSMAANRLSYQWNLKGPSLSIDTACSSSLVAVHLAAESIARGDCDQAIVAGVNLLFAPEMYVNCEKARLLAADGRCKSFDHRADGYVRAEGVGVVVLKPLPHALRDRNPIQAVLLGSGTNQDGRTNGLTAPSGAAQCELLRATYDQAGISPDSISLVEAHGTGTQLGDPIEVEALRRFFAPHVPAQSIAIGSVKTQIGHAESAAGMASLLRVILAMQHRLLPPTMHFEAPNPHIEFESSPFFVPNRLLPWVTKGTPRRAGINAFGFGGSNAHVIVEEAPLPVQHSESKGGTNHVFVLSAASESSLRSLAKRYADFFATVNHVDLADICYTATTGRGHFRHRLAIVADSLPTLREKLELQIRTWDSAPSALSKNPREFGEAQELTSAFPNPKSPEESHALAYLNGEDIDWEDFHAGTSRRSVSLPSYPFDRQRYWIDDIPISHQPDARTSSPEASTDSSSLGEIANWFYDWRWIASPRKMSRETPRGTWLGLVDDEGTLNRLGSRLRETGARWVEVRAGAPFSGIEADACTIDPRDPDDFRRLVEAMDRSFSDWRGIVHGWNLFPHTPIRMDFRAMDDNQRRGPESLLQLAQNVATRRALPFELWVVTDRGEPIDGSPAIDPMRMSLRSLLQAVALEYPELSCRGSISRRWSTFPSPWSTNFGPNCILPARTRIAYHNRERFAPRLLPMKPPPPRRSLPLRTAGVYLITGGMGNLGLHVARFFAQHAPSAKIVLLSRSPFPSRSQWDRLLLDPNTPANRLQQLRACVEMENLGAQVLPMVADVADFAVMKGVLAELRHRFGSISGVVHAAGVLEDGLLCRKSVTEFRRIFHPKAAGTVVLHELTKSEPLDFFLLCSSTAAIVPEAGHGTYGAANAFMDGIAYFRRSHGLPASTLNWGPWQDTPAAHSAAYRRLMESAGSRFMAPQHAISALEVALEADLVRQVVISLEPSRRVALGNIVDSLRNEDTGIRHLARLESASKSLSVTLADAFARFRTLGARLDEVCAAYAARVLDQFGVLRTKANFTLNALVSQWGLSDKSTSILSRLLAMLIEDGVVKEANGAYAAIPRVPTADETQLLQRLREDYPELDRQIALLQRSGEALFDILRGAKDPLDALFPSGNIADAFAVYAESPFMGYYHELAVAAIQSWVASQVDSNLNILEIGAGTGSATARLLPVLPVDRCRYEFTDLSRSFLRRAEKRFREYPFVRYQLLDIERNPADQGFDDGVFDVVLAVDVLHATKDILATLTHVRQLLRPGGMLVLIEATRATRFGELTFGLTDGWWRFVGDKTRALQPLLSDWEWKRHLGSLGFQQAQSYAPANHESDALDHHLIVAFAPDKPIEPASESLPGDPNASSSAPCNDGHESEARRLRELLSEVLQTPPSELDPVATFSDQGMDSLMALEFVAKIKRQWNIEWFGASTLFAHPSLDGLAKYLAGHDIEQPKGNAVSLAPFAHRALAQSALPDHDAIPAGNSPDISPSEETTRPGSSTSSRATNVLVPSPEMTSNHVSEGRRDIAVIGYACLFPDANNATEFWSNLREGKCSIQQVPEERWDLALRIAPGLANLRRYSEIQGGFLDGIDRFDPLFFRISPTEATQLDPRHRLFLETAYLCAEHAGYGGNALRGTNTGVFVGSGTNDYLQGLTPEECGEYWATGSNSATLPARLTYYLDLQGPALPVDTACSSGLVAVHLAMRSLRLGECDYAFAGAVHLNLRLENFAAFRKMGALSPTARCHAFDAAADGFIPSEGICVLLLRPLEEALKNGDNIVAVLKGSAVNNDGKTNGLTAPNPLAQTEVIERAWRDADIDPSTITCMEAHGTGTALGDPIEITGLTEAFRRYTKKKQFCALTTVKSNIGHSEAASGLAGLMKLILALEHQEIPPIPNFASPNLQIRFEESPFYVLDSKATWRRGDQPRRAGVSAFGFSGTNAHLVIEESPKMVASSLRKDRPAHLLCLSARSPRMLQRQVEALLTAIGSSKPPRLADLCFTLNSGRPEQRYRLAVVASSLDQSSDRLHRYLDVERRPFLQGSLVFYGDAKSERIDSAELRRELSSRMEELPSSLIQAFASWFAEPQISSLCAELISESRDATVTPSHDDWSRVLSAAAWLYTQGHELDGLAFDAGRDRRRVPLPPTLFEKKSYWRDPVGSPQDLPRVPDSDRDRLYQIHWIAAPQEAETPETALDGVWLIFSDGSPAAEFCLASIRERGGDGILIHSSKVNDGKTMADLSLGDEAPEDFDRLFQECKHRGALRGILWFAESDGPLDIDSLADLEISQRQGVIRLFQFAKAAASARITERLVLFTVTRGAQPFGLNGPIAIGNSTLLGLARVLPYELKNFVVRSLDFEPAEPDSQIAGTSMRELVGLLNPEKPIAVHQELVFRRGVRYEPTLKPLKGGLKGAITSPWKMGGTYLITGGLGGIGAQISERLLKDHGVRLWLVGRTTLPVTNDLAEWCKQHPNDVRVRAAQTYLHLKTLGGQVEYRSADVSRPNEVAIAFRECAEKFGPITGVLHAAGTIDLERFSLRAKTMESFVGILAPKAAGSWNLAAEVKRRGIAQFVLFSSISCLSGRLGAGECDYASASRFERDFAYFLRQQGMENVTTLLWSEWSGRGMLERGAVGPIVRELGLTPFSEDEAWKAFEESVRTGKDHVVLLQSDSPSFDPRRLMEDPPSDKEQKNWTDCVTSMDVACLSAARQLEPSLQLLRELRATLENISVAFITRLFARAGLFITAGEMHASETFASQLRVPRKWERLLRRFADILAENGSLRKTSAGYHADQPLVAFSDDTFLLSARTRFSNHPFAASQIDTLIRCGEALESVLKDGQSVVPLLFPDGRTAETAAFYRESPIAKCFQHVVAAAFTVAVDQARGTAPVRCLEIGAGTGSTTESLLPACSDGNIEYWFTDLSPGLVRAAQAKWSEHSFLRYGVLDIEEDPASQGYKSASFDIVIAVNVFHATRDLKETVANARRLLAPGGRLILLELTEPRSWLDLTFGLTEGWWRFDDANLRSNHPLVSAETWCSLLADHGFSLQAAFPRHGVELGPVTQSVVVAIAGRLSMEARPNIRSVTRQTVSTDTETRNEATYPGDLREYLVRRFCETLSLERKELDLRTNILDLGFDSILALQLRATLQRDLGVELPATILFSQPTVEALADYLMTSHGPAIGSRIGQISGILSLGSLGETETPTTDESRGNWPNADKPLEDRHDIAVIGMACRFPDANTPEAFWRNLQSGHCSVRHLPGNRRRLLLEQDPNNETPGGYLDSIDLFDADFFRISPREAEYMDPQQRIFLEVVWEALERASCSPARLSRARTAVFAGVNFCEYRDLLVTAGVESSAHSHSGTTPSMVASRVSYLLNLRGPSLTVDTACSSGLVAVHLACQSLRRGEADIAIAGAVNLNLTSRSQRLVQQMEMLAPDGQCKSFDDRADGFVRGEGVCAFLLKSLPDAVRDGDEIHAVIRGTAVNNDGQRKAGLAAPSASAQRDVILDALADAGVSADTISYVEAHGTGTRLGDPIEFEGLTQAFAVTTSRHAYCALGTVKTNIGHLESAAGLAGLMKAILAIQHEELPPTLHFESPNRHLDVAASPFYFSDRCRTWPSNSTLRRAGVSSFGFGGTNAHVILEQNATSPKPAPLADRPAELLTISARRLTPLRTMVAEYQSLLQREEHSWREICALSNLARAHHECRLAVVASSAGELRAHLGRFLQDGSANDLVHFGDGEGAELNGDWTRDILERMTKASTQTLKQVLACCHGRLFDEQFRLPIERLVQEHAALDAALDLRQFLELIAEFHVKGASIDWELVHQGRVVRRVPLPTYPFQRQSYWVMPRKHELLSAGKRTNSAEAEAVRQWLYLPRWTPLPNRRLQATLERTWLIVEESTGIGSALAQKISSLGADTLLVQAGQSFQGIQNNRGSVLRFESQETARLAEAIAKRTNALTGIVYLAKGITGLYCLTRELDLRHLLTGTCICVVTDAGYSLSETEQLHSLEEGMVASFSLGLTQEYGCRALALDLDLALLTHEEAAERIASELLAEPSETLIAIRGNRRYSRTLTRLELPTSEETRFQVSPDAAVLITGGLGNLGLEFAGYFASLGVKHLYLTGRSGLPNRTEWSETLARTPDTATSSRIAKILDIENQGCTVSPVKADVTDERAMHQIVQEIIARHGRLFGIVHAAGSLNDSLLRNKTVQELHALLAPKVEGARVLHRLTRDLDLAFFVLCSSTASLAPLPGQASYAAANAYLDSMAHWRREKLGLPAISINWGFWGDTDVAASGRYRRFVESSGVLPISNREGICAFDLLLHASPVQAVVLRKNESFADRSVVSRPCSWRELEDRARKSSTTRWDDVYSSLEVVLSSESTLDRLAAGYVAKVLLENGIYPEIGDEVNETTFQEHVNVHAKFRRLIPTLFRILERTGILRPTGPKRWLLAAALRATGVDEVAKARQEFPAASPQINLLEACGSQLGDVLRGVIDPLQLLFPGGSLTAAEALYKESPAARYFGRLAGDIVSYFVARLQTTPTILEIGAGTGGTTNFILPALKDSSCEYVVTDLSSSLVARAAREHQSYSFTRHKVLDISRDPNVQGFSPGTIDIVVAANVLHATRDLKATLAHVRQLLKPGGILLLIEATRTQSWGELTFGLTDGWWAFEDHSLRPDGPLLSVPQWERLLAEVGFESTAFFPNQEVKPAPQATPAQHLFLARASSEPTLGSRTTETTASPRRIVEVPNVVPREISPREKHDLERIVIEIFSQVLHAPEQGIDPQRSFQDQGVDSLLGLEILSQLQTRLRTGTLSPSSCIGTPTPELWRAI